MSASREKKNRQELAAQGHVDPRVERQQKEAAERKKNKLIYGGVAVLFVIVAAVVLLYNSGIFQRSAVALTLYFCIGRPESPSAIASTPSVAVTKARMVSLSATPSVLP